MSHFHGLITAGGIREPYGGLALGSQFKYGRLDLDPQSMAVFHGCSKRLNVSTVFSSFGNKRVFCKVYLNFASRTFSTVVFM